MFTVPMEGLLPVAAAAVLFVLLHVAVAAYLYRASVPGRRESASESVPAQDRVDRAGGPDQERVSCPTCGVPNDPSYRFCRRCVADLRNGVTVARGRDGGERLGS